MHTRDKAAINSALCDDYLHPELGNCVMKKKNKPNEGSSNFIDRQTKISTCPTDDIILYVKL